MIAATRSILISAPRESVRLYLRNLENMADYEQKVDKIQVNYPDSESGFYEVSGKFWGIPWRGAFTVSFTRDGGFRSEMVRGPLRRVAGAFHLRPVSGGTLLTHDEQYLFPLPLRPLGFFIKRWIGRSIELELAAIKEGAERLNRQLQLRDIEAAGLADS